jgi:hypothetical protein
MLRFREPHLIALAFDLAGLDAVKMLLDEPQKSTKQP